MQVVVATIFISLNKKNKKTANTRELDLKNEIYRVVDLRIIKKYTDCCCLANNHYCQNSLSIVYFLTAVINLFLFFYEENGLKFCKQRPIVHRKM